MTETLKLLVEKGLRVRTGFAVALVILASRAPSNTIPAFAESLIAAVTTSWMELLGWILFVSSNVVWVTGVFLANAIRSGTQPRSRER